MKLTNKARHALIALHFLLGLIAVYAASFFKFYYLGFFMVSIFIIVFKETTKNRITPFIIAYFVGMELLIRLSGAILLDQFGKYSIILLILVSLIKTNRIYHIKPKVFVLFIMLMLVSLLFMNESYNRNVELVSFYLSGPICLALCVIYFYQMKMEFNRDFMGILFVSMLPIMASLVCIFLKSKSVQIDDLIYGANSSQSGGYGPNQVAVVLGYAIVVVIAAAMFKKPITGYFLFDIILLLVLVYRILITFSRGGFISAIISIVIAMAYVRFKNRNFFNTNKRAVFFVLFGFVLIGLSWYKTNETTGNKLAERYDGYTGDTKYSDRREFSSGRDKLMLIELEVFRDNWIVGVGPGMATPYRSALFRRGEETVASHTEFTRMLAEHGLYGLLALLILFLFPLVRLRKVNNSTEGFVLVLFVTLSILTLSHNSHRLVLPSFLYGMAFVHLYSGELDSKRVKLGIINNDLERKN